MNVWVKRGLWGLAAWKLLAPEAVPDFPGPQRVPMELPGRTVFANGIELFVREAGPDDAPVMVLVHGWGDDSMMLFSRLAPLLVGDFRVVMVDNRNNGKSDRLRGDYTIAEMAVDLDGALGQLGITAATVFGFSMGGLVAQELARTFPDRVARLALSGTAAAVPPLATLPVPLVQAAVTLLRAMDRLSRTEVSWLRTRYLMSVGAVAPEHARWAHAAHQGRDPDLYWASAIAIAGFDSRDWIGELDVPTMAIITDGDQLMRPAAQGLLAELLPDAVVHHLRGRHEAPLTQAGEYARHLRDFATT